MNMKDWIFNAKTVKVLVSDDGLRFMEVFEQDFNMLPADYAESLHTVDVHFEPVEALYVEVVIEPFDCPEGHSGYGYPGWVFVDEIMVY